MRLIYEIAFGDVTENMMSWELWVRDWFISIADINIRFGYLPDNLDDNNIWIMEFFNWYELNIRMNDILWETDLEELSLVLPLLYAQMNDMMTIVMEMSQCNWRFAERKVNYGINMYSGYNISYFFFTWYVLYILYKLFVELMYAAGYQYVMWSQFLTIYIYSWIYNGVLKVESVEEIMCLVVLWPWCIFLIFTHLCVVSEYMVLFCIIEWGLPVFYGLILLTEHLWMFGVNMTGYLMGIRGRKNLFATFIEDLIAVIIMVARVVLQSIRGIVVGMFHFICREALLNMSRWWEHEFVFNKKNSIASIKIGNWYDLISIIIDLAMAFMGLLLIVGIMFLQLTFLIISIWLFCKCWFISFYQFNIDIGYTVAQYSAEEEAVSYNG